MELFLPTSPVEKAKIYSERNFITALWECKGVGRIRNYELGIKNGCHTYGVTLVLSESLHNS